MTPTFIKAPSGGRFLLAAAVVLRLVQASPSLAQSSPVDLTVHEERGVYSAS